MPQLVASLLVLLVGSLAIPHFYQVVLQGGWLSGSLIDILGRIALVVLLAIGMTLVIAAGGIDLSVGAVMAITSVMTAAMMVARYNPSVVPLTVLGSGILVGLRNGILVVILKTQPFTATLILTVTGRGVAQLIVSGQIVTSSSPELSWSDSGSFLLSPTSVIIVLLTLVMFWLLTRKTVLGISIGVVGINIRAIRNAGVSTRIIMMPTYALGGLYAAITDIIITADIRGASANNTELRLELGAVLVVVTGGGSLMDGRFNLLLSVIGVLIIQGINAGILLPGLQPELNQVARAAVALCVLAMQP